MKQLATNYSFNVTANTVTLTGLDVPLNYVLLIINATRNQIIYNLAEPALGAASYQQGENSVITLNADLAGMANSDQLTIFYDNGAESQIVLVQGPVGPAGVDGDDGASAYEVAVADGYPGTEADWLLSLKGADGDPGPAPAGTGIVTVVDGVLQTPKSLAEIGAQPAGAYATLDGDNKIPAAQIPDLAITDYLGPCANEAEMLAKTGQKGDWVTRSDDGKVYVITETSPSQVWTALIYPVAPPAPVSSVAGKIGDVTLVGEDVTVSSNFTVTNVSQGVYSNGTVIPAGTSLEAVIKNMLQTFQAPTVSISGLTASIELRSDYSGTINRTFTQNNGGSVTGYRLQLNGSDSQVGATLPANFSVSGTGVTQDQTWRLFVDYAASGPVNAGTATSNQITVSPRRRSFFGADTQTVAVTDSVGVRGLAAGAGSTGNVLGLADGATFTLKIPVGTKRVTIAYPANLRDLTSVAYVEAGNAAVADTFTKSNPNIPVSAAVAGQDETAYKVFTYITQAGFASEATYIITI